MRYEWATSMDSIPTSGHYLALGRMLTSHERK